ncbi:MAG: hypothetical protein IT371_06815 [Deltaproteobacteria bacterium]|nr:hypothetical protein [Deltaproteobacteria bacterium]
MSFLRRARIPLIIYFVCLAAYAGTSAGFLKQHSQDNHYVYLADSFLHGQLSLRTEPPHQNDWALVHELQLRDGRKVRGTFLQVGGHGDDFKTTKGQRLVITPDMITSRRHAYYVSFPWFPAVLMMPFVALFGMGMNDVLFTVLLAAFNPVLVYFLLRRLAALGLSQRRLSEDLWLVALFAFGTVHYFVSVSGQVWFTAHVVGVGLTACYAIAALEGKHPVLAGLCLGLGFVTRTPIPFAFPLVVGEILRRNLAPTAADAPAPDPCHRPELVPWLRALWPRLQKGPATRQLGLAALPAVAVAGVAGILNFLRFDRFGEFGHYYLNVRWAERIQRWGLFNYHYIPRNLAALLTLLPRISAQKPFVQVSMHGLSLFVTTPMFGFLFWPRRRSGVQPWLYLSCLLPMIAHLMYQHTGWQQFGFRFSLDYTVFLVALLAVGGYRIGKLAKILILFGIAVNTFGAVTYYRMWDFYWDGMFPVE